MYLEKLRKDGDFIFTLLNKAMFASHRIAFCSVSRYDKNTRVRIKRRFHFHVATHVMCL